MLSRTADSLFWLARYVERAENMSRLVDMGRRIATVPGTDGGHRGDWPSILAAAGCAPLDPSDGSDAAQIGRAAVRRLLVARDNPSSVASCFDQARANARGARAALTKEMWEAVNEAWIEFRTLSPERLANGALSPLLDRIKQVGAQFRGATDSSSLRTDVYDFLRLGAYLERLDSSARLMDVASRAHAENRARRDGGAAVDDFHWVSALRACGVLRGYHAACRGEHDGRTIAQFLILDGRCPRSLAHCLRQISAQLAALDERYGERRACHDVAEELSALVAATDLDDLYDGDLRGFLSTVIRRNNDLSASIAEAYYFAAKRAPDPEQSEADAGTGAPTRPKRRDEPARPKRRRGASATVDLQAAP